MNIYERLTRDHDVQRKLAKRIMTTSGDTEERRQLFDELKSEVDSAARRALYEEAITLARDDLADLRLYHQAINWAMKANIDATLRSDNFVHLKWITVN